MKLSEIWIRVHTCNRDLFATVENCKITVRVLDMNWKHKSSFKSKPAYSLRQEFCISRGPIDADHLLVSGKWGIK